MHVRDSLPVAFLSTSDFLNMRSEEGWLQVVGVKC